MKREIKFRAWDKMNKRMHDVLTLKDTRICGFADLGDEIMQFTGLTDKFGKDIYEGDILNVFIKEKFTEMHRNFIGTIEWYVREGRLRLVHETLGKHFFGISQAESLEVIGNIYENPELINPK